MSILFNGTTKKIPISKMKLKELKIIGRNIEKKWNTKILKTGEK